MKRTRKQEPLSSQMKRRSSSTAKRIRKPKYEGDFGQVISTGSTLLDLEISGGRIRGGGLPGGILVEAFGPSGSGKTVLLSEVAGAVQRGGGEIMFKDPEGRLNKRFAKIFDLDIKDEDYSRPDTVPEVFTSVRKWKPEENSKKPSKIIHGIFTDSLAALSTDMEMDSDDGDPFGGRRAKEFSEEFRKTCRILSDKNYLMVCSNQVRDVIGATKYQSKTKSPGGRAMEFYPSLRLAFTNASKIKREKTIYGKKESRIVGVETSINVFKSSIWNPFGTARLTILFNYGIDDIRQNLQYIKDHSKHNVYTCRGRNLSNTLEEAIQIIETKGWENRLREETIDLWEYIGSKFVIKRKPKRR